MKYEVCAKSLLAARKKKKKREQSGCYLHIFHVTLVQEPWATHRLTSRPQPQGFWELLLIESFVWFRRA